MHWSYWTQILTAEPSLQTHDWFSYRSRVCLGLRHSCPDFSWGCHYCVLWDLIWHIDLWASLCDDAGMCFPQRKVPFTFHVVSLIVVRSAESRAQAWYLLISSNPRVKVGTCDMWGASQFVQSDHCCLLCCCILKLPFSPSIPLSLFSVVFSSHSFSSWIWFQWY